MDIFLRVDNAGLMHGQNLDQTADKPGTSVASVRAGHLADHHDIVQVMGVVAARGLPEDLFEERLRERCFPAEEVKEVR